jgi:hypothetical protein
MTGVLQFSENVLGTGEAKRIFCENFAGSLTMFTGSTIHNSLWSELYRKNFNVCILGSTDTGLAQKQEKSRRMFFYQNWL